MAKPKRPKSTPSDILSKYELDETSKAILKYKIQYPAMLQGEVAELIGVHRTVVAKRMEQETWKQAFNEFFMPAKEVIESSGQRLAKRYVALAYSKDEKVAERVMRTILTSLGFLKTENLSIETFEPMIIKFENSQKEVHIVNQPKAIDVAPTNG